ncbi:MAG: lipopolysaccharide biosynthesis protein, partial [Anaerolineae bacterium]|nr:lipopolysaccharide biosynthesis protein [Anaerolineae bacterium]
MELEEYIRIARERGWIVILLAVLVAGAVFVYSELFMSDIYQADIKITVRPARAD